MIINVQGAGGSFIKLSLVVVDSLNEVGRRLRYSGVNVFIRNGTGVTATTTNHAPSASGDVTSTAATINSTARERVNKVSVLTLITRR